MQPERRAVSALFLSNGALFATVLPRLPEIKADLDLSNGQLGLALLGVGVGGLAGSTASRWVLPRTGSRRLAMATTAAVALLVPLIGVAPTAAVLFVVLAVVGTANALTDVAMNVSGIEVQRRLARPVLSGMHAVWSIGAVAGALVGSAAAGLRVPVPLHLAVVAATVLALVLVVSRDVPAVSGAGEGTPTGARWSPALALLCAVALLGAVVEDVPASWSAVYLVEHTDAPAGAAGLAFTAYMAAMVAGRLLGDRWVARFGPVAVVRAGGLAVASGLLAGLLAGTTTAAVVGFAGVGLGASALFPAMFSAAGALPGQGVAAVNTVSRVGFLAAPALVGSVADGVGLPLALGLVVVPAALGVALLAGAVRPAEG